MDVVGKKTLEVMEKAENYNLWLFELIRPYLKVDILEIGSGIGNFTVLLSKIGKVYASDIDKFYLKHLSQKFKDISVGYTNVESGESDYEKKRFNSIVCMNVLEHIKDDIRALKNMFSFLRKDGKLILLVPAHQFAYGELDVHLGHFRRYSKDEITKKLKGIGFRINYISYVNPVGLFGWLLNARILKRKIIPEGQLGIFDKIIIPILKLEKYIKPPFGLSVFVVAQKK